MLFSAAATVMSGAVVLAPGVVAFVIVGPSYIPAAPFAVAPPVVGVAIAVV